MELQQLRYFQAVAETGHLTQAAEMLYISQPALSHTIRRLEKELGLPLFQKKGRGLELTQYGQHFYYRVKAIFHELELARQEQQDLLGADDTPLKMGSTISGITLPVLEAFCHENPDMRFHHSMLRENEALMSELRSGALDVGFCDLQFFPADIEHTTIWKDRLYVLIHNQNPLSKSTALELSDLSDESIILSDSEASLRDMIEALLPEQVRRTAMTAANMMEAQRLCSLGMGLTITSGFFLELQVRESMHEGKSLLDFMTPVPLSDYAWDISVVWRRSDYYRLYLRHFLAFVHAFFRERSEQQLLSVVSRPLSDDASAVTDAAAVPLWLDSAARPESPESPESLPDR